MKQALFSTCPAVILFTCLLSAPAADAPTLSKTHLSATTFPQFQQTIRTDYAFRWRCLPWEINPGEAFEKAAKEDKPILCFGGHDGVPLGFE